MTVPNENAENAYNGNGTTATYAYTFRVFLSSQIFVVISDTANVLPDVTLVENTDYTVTGAGTSGGNVVLVNGTGLLVGGFLPTGKRITITRDLPLVQLLDIKNQGPYKPEAIESAFDYVTMILQQQNSSLDRQIRLPISETPTAAAQVVPGVSSRASRFFGWDANGNIVAANQVSSTMVSAFMATVLDDLTAAAARTTLGFAGAGGTVQAVNVEAAAIVAAALATDAVITAKIQAAAVTTAKLADANVTLAKLEALVQQSLAQTGDYKACASSAAQTGWLICDGSAVSRSTYSSLFSSLGTAYGSGDGSTTFNVPNLKGRFLRGVADYANVNGSGSASSSNATFTAHPYKQTGTRVRMASGALTGLSTATNYWVIVVDANTLAFATTRANALLGTKIAISGANSAVIQQYEDPDGTSRVAQGPGGSTGNAIGTYQDEDVLPHTHTYGLVSYSADNQAGGGSITCAVNPTTVTTASGQPTVASPAAAVETRPRNIGCYYFIKI